MRYLAQHRDGGERDSTSIVREVVTPTRIEVMHTRVLAMHNLAGRRSFLKRTAVLSTAFALAPAFARRARAATNWGPLVDDPDGLLDLPEGFSYRILQRSGDEMSDGVSMPGAPDGMACFAGPEGTLILMRNHEITNEGGVTRLVLNADAELISSNVVVAGTTRNCAGGPSPWGWLTCEESTDNGRGHVYLCDIAAESEQPQDQITGYGRYNHEAVAIDPDTFYAYLTEDRSDGCLYRFVPDDPSEPFVGRLQALRVIDGPQDTGDVDVGESYAIDWVEIENSNPADDTVRLQAHANGAAEFVRGEGIWYQDGRIVFACTSGGPNGAGQIFELRDGPQEATLECIAVATADNGMVNPDNITISPWGHVVVVEDRDGPCHIHVLDPSGELVPFGRVASGDSELAGICFSADGRFMFVNSQTDGITYVIDGPFKEILGDGLDPEGADDGGETGESTGGGEDGGSTSGGDSGEGGGSAGGTAGGASGGESSGGGSESGASFGPGADDDATTGCGCNTSEPSADGVVLAGALLGAYAITRKGSTDDGSSAS